MEIKEEFELIDPWRVNRPQLRRYTWRQKNPIKQGRLDFFLVSQDILSETQRVNISPGYRTDHSLIELSMASNVSNRGKGFWKFNVSLLRDPKYVEMVHKCITEVTEQYKNVTSTKETPTFSIDDQLFFEVLKMEIRGKTIQYSSYIKKQGLQKEQILQSQIVKLEKVCQESPNENRLQELENKKKELENSRELMIKALMMRSKARWVEHGEKPTKYFCSLEKRNYVNKTITLISNETGDITEPSKILDTQAEYYKHLYTGKTDNTGKDIKG